MADVFIRCRMCDTTVKVVSNRLGRHTMKVKAREQSGIYELSLVCPFSESVVVRIGDNDQEETKIRP